MFKLDQDDDVPPKAFSISTVVTAAYHRMYRYQCGSTSTGLNVLKSPNFDQVVGFQGCKAVIVDEAQDVSDIQYKFVMLLAKALGRIRPLPVIMVGDPNQNIYQFQGGSDKHLMNHPGDLLTLVDNYRSTKQIVDFINPFRVWNNLPPLVAASGKTGVKPAILLGPISKLIENILQDIKMYNVTGVELENVAIIAPVKKCRPIFDYSLGENRYANIGLQLIANCLQAHNIPFVQHYDLSQGDESRKNAESTRKGHINLLTSHGSKGLEFDNVHVLNFHFKTQGREPTKEKYDEFKYLWYVSLSRARHVLKIYVDETKHIFPTLANVPANLYDVVYIGNGNGIGNTNGNGNGNTNGGSNTNKQLTFVPPKFIDEKRQIAFTITESIKSLTEEQLYEFEQICDFTTTKTRLFNVGYEGQASTHCFEFDKYSSLYGKVAESIFYYYYSRNYIIDLKNRVHNIIELPQLFLTAVWSLFNKVGFTRHEFTLNSLCKYKNSLDSAEKKLYDHLVNRCAHHTNPFDTPIRIVIPNSVQMTDTSSILQKCAKLVALRDKLDGMEYHYTFEIMSDLFDIQLFYYQLEHEAAYMIRDHFVQSERGRHGGDPFRIHKESFFRNSEQIRDYARSLVCSSTKLQLQRRCDHPSIPLYGVCDLVQWRANSRNTVIELKFSHEREVNSKYVLQLLLYYNGLFPAWTKESISIEVWNICLGVRTIISFSSLDKWVFTQAVCRNLLDGAKMRDMVFAYDIKSPTAWCFKEPRLELLISSGINSNLNINLQATIGDIVNRCDKPTMLNSYGLGSKPIDRFIDSHTAQLIMETDIHDLIQGCDKKELIDMYTIATGKLVPKCDNCFDDVKLLSEILTTIGYSRLAS